VGFVDAEGYFGITKTFGFVFNISLYIDDIDVLRTIRDTLFIGNVNIYGNTARFEVKDYMQIENVLLPIFSIVSLQTRTGKKLY
jgi:hypothetical protein